MKCNKRKIWTRTTFIIIGTYSEKDRDSKRKGTYDVCSSTVAFFLTIEPLLHSRVDKAQTAFLTPSRFCISLAPRTERGVIGPRKSSNAQRFENAARARAYLRGGTSPSGKWERIMVERNMNSSLIKSVIRQKNVHRIIKNSFLCTFLSTRQYSRKYIQST